MNRNSMFVIAILVAALGLAIFLPWLFSHQSQTLGPLSYEMKEVSFDRAGHDNRDTYSIEVKYPYFTDGFSDEVGQKVNNTLTAHARSTALAVKNDFEDQYRASDPDNTYIPTEPLMYKAEHAVTASLDILPFINITEQGYQYTGGAHGISVVRTFVFDVRSGNELTLKTLFAGDYLTALSRQSLVALKKIDPELATFTFAEDGTLPDANNFSAFTIQPDGLHIVFQNYQVAPYVAGEPEIVISYASLASVISPEYRDMLK